MDTLLYEASHIRPSERQLKIQNMEFYGFVHYGMNTYTGSEWGKGDSKPELFNPTNLDTDNWAKAMKSAGMKGIIITSKHHDGFCLWPSEYTDYSVKNSPWKDGKGDVVKDLSESCKKYGLELGIYLSPWDRHEKCYGTDEYNKYYVNQLKELLTNYGEVFTVWLDGACGEGPNGKKQVYDWDTFYKTVRELQPNATINVMGPDVRWCGNEEGDCRQSEWSVVPIELRDHDYIADNSQKEDIGELLANINEQVEDLGSREKIAASKELIWFPSEVDTSIRPRWFYHQGDDDKVKSLDDLIYLYCNSVGGNNTLLLNIPPTPEGIINPIDEKRLNELGEALNEMFSDDLTANKTWKNTINDEDIECINDNNKDTFWTGESSNFTESIEIDLEKQQTISSIHIQEYIENGQRIEEFDLSIINDRGEWESVYEGTTVGYKKICLIEDVKTQYVRLTIKKSRYYPEIRSINIYNHRKVVNNIKN